jgi:hypothetical protein
MAINFPTSLDTLPKPANSQPMNQAGAQAGDIVSDLALAIEALQAKVGANTSAVATSLDYFRASVRGTGGIPAGAGNFMALTANAGGTGWGIAGETVAEFVRASVASSGVNFQLTSGNTGRGTISFGDTDAATVAQLQYRHDSDDFVFRIAAGNRGFWKVQGLIIGGDYVPSTALSSYGRFNAVTNSAGACDGVQIARYRNSSALAADLEFIKSQSSTIGAHGAVPAGSQLGAITWSGSDGAAFQRAAEIRVDANVLATPGIVRARVIFSAANASGVMTEYMRSVDGSGIQVTGPITGSTTLALAGLQVLGARKTGWGAASGTATRTTFATGSVTLPQLAERVKALIDDFLSHGSIGA